MPKIKTNLFAQGSGGHRSFRLLAALMACGCISRCVKLLAPVWMDQEAAERDEGRHHGMVPHTFKVGLLSVKPSWERPHGYTQERCVSWVILNPVKLTVKVSPSQREIGYGCQVTEASDRTAGTPRAQSSADP